MLRRRQPNPVRAGWAGQIAAASLLVLLCGSLASAQELFRHAPADKIDGEILAHGKEKAALAALPAPARSAEFARLGFNPANPDAEDCALYVKQALTAAEKTELAALGVLVYPTYVKPVPGKHPYGFYLARVAFDALDEIRADARIARLASAEFRHEALNNAAAGAINADDVHAGNGTTARDGSGVTIAVADSGFDTASADFPAPVEAYDMTDGTGVGTWGVSVLNTVSNHGSHVAGSALGRGTNSGGLYIGSAPGASAAFYKIGNDITASASETDEIEALARAAAQGYDIFTMSYGGYDTYMDGSSAMCQAIDDAVVNDGVAVFVSAGNSAQDAEHDSVSVAPGATSAVFTFTIDNTGSGIAYTAAEQIRLIWIDDAAGDANLSMAINNLGGGESLVQMFSGTSTRGTDAKRYTLTPNVGAGASKTYNITLTNGAGSGSTPLVHLYAVTGIGTFDSPNENYTVGNPAVADEAIAVAAYVHRASWTSWTGAGISFGETLGTRATFSSRGPRIDGVQKPELAAPGSAMISVNDANVPEGTSALRIDDDGSNDNTGPTNYFVAQGTSMACPSAAGAAALILEADPSRTPAQVKSALTSTASLSGSPNNDLGYGLINVLAAVQSVPVELSEFSID